MLPGTFCGIQVNLLLVIPDCYLILARFWALGANCCPERQDDGADGQKLETRHHWLLLLPDTRRFFFAPVALVLNLRYPAQRKSCTRQFQNVPVD